MLNRSEFYTKLDMGPLGMPELIIIAVLGVALLSIVFWIWMLVDCISKEPEQGNDKVVWVIVIALLGALGALIYLFARRPVRIQQFGR
ncbi:MAG: PLDc N-terminal domain-containing protein [Akkermansiaceae bacterium]